MNKFTKLLSVFAIAGAVSAGVATLAGCGAKHTGEKHEAVAATCTQTGTKEYYTCNDDDCKGKYYLDEACTVEVTMEELTIAALGHSATKTDAHDATCTTDGNPVYYTCSGTECAGKYYEDEACTKEITDIVIEATGHSELYEDNGDGTHKVTCEHGDLTASNVAHVDEDGDSKCDKCEALFFAPGKYYSTYYGEIEIKQGGIIVFNDNEYTLSAVTEDEDTEVLSATFTITVGDLSQDYILTKTETGYSIGYRSYIPVPETLAEEMADFAGVYSFSGEYVYYYAGGYYKLLSLSITEEGQIVYSSIQVNEDGTAYEGAKAVTLLADASDSGTKYNKISAYPINITATSAKAATIELYIGYDSTKNITLTKTAEAAPVVPENLGLTEYSYFANADESYVLVVGSNNIYRLNDKSVTIVGGNATDGYLVKTYDASYNDINLVVKVNATDNTVAIYEVGGTEALATLAVKEQVIPTFAVTEVTASVPVLNTEPLVDVFNSSYAYYKIETAGWYYFGSGDTNNATIYTKVTDHEVDVTQGVVKVYAGFASKGVQLAAGDIIAVSAYYDYSLLAIVEDTNRDDIYSPEFEGFDEEYYGTYTYEYTSWGYTESITFEISADGIKYRNNEVKVVAFDDIDYLIDFWGSAIKFSFDDDGNIYVEYDNSIYEYGYTAVKDGNSSGSEEEETDTTVYVTAGDNSIDIHALLGTAEITLSKVGVWTVTFGSDVQYILVGSSPKVSGSTIEVTDTAVVITVYAAVNNKTGEYANPVTINFELTSGSGEDLVKEEDDGLKVGDNTVTASYNGIEYTFTATEAGDYTITYDAAGWLIDSTDTYMESGTTLTLTAGQTISILCSTANYVSGTIEYTLTIAKEDGYAKAGENTVDINAKNYGQGEITLNKVGVWEITYGSDVDYITLDDGVMPVTTVTVTDTPVVIVVHGAYDEATESYVKSASFTLTLTSGSGEALEESDDVGSESGLKVGDNTVTASFAGIDYTFTASGAGTYTFTYDAAGYVGFYDSNNILEWFSSGKTFTLEAGETLKLCCSTYDEVSGTIDYTLTITKG
ncbi:MAG: hypothetical protein ACI4QI_02580 [Candidatus Coproplasma sp.]